MLRFHLLAHTAAPLIALRGPYRFIAGKLAKADPNAWHAVLKRCTYFRVATAGGILRFPAMPKAERAQVSAPLVYEAVAV